MCKPKAGFSFFEVILVIALLGCMLALSAPFFNFSVFRVKSEVDRLHAVLLYLQRKALIEQKCQFLTFDLSKHCYHAERMYALEKGVFFGIKNGMYGPPAKPKTLLASPCTFKNNTAVFYPDGTISAGAIVLIDGAKNTAYALSCDASALTHIRIYTYGHEWQLM